jgi:UDP-N-acetylmuramoyl-L-alanyl-D-glutamate--2,6-diaminopimelate ligase
MDPPGPRARTLADLLPAVPGASLVGDAAVVVSSITADSRQAGPGSLFVAYHGVAADGHRYIGDAVSRGAVAIVGEQDLPAPPPGVRAYARVPSGRLALAQIAAAWYGFPSRRLKVIGVTGTDGKTTTSTLIQSILQAASRPTGLVSTVSARIGAEEVDTGFHTTTPDAMALQGYLARMAAAGMECAVLETTSHGLEQERAAAVDYDVAVLTNLTHEHLDQHGTMDAYRDAKARLFRYLSETRRKPGLPKTSILNADDASYPFFAAIPADRHWTYGLTAPAEFTAAGLDLSARGTAFTAVTPSGSVAVESRLLGRFNAYNLLAAIAAGAALEAPAEAIRAGIAAVTAVTGRMEPISLPGSVAALPAVIVDFAHTPNALANALELGRTLTAGRLIAVYGCAGLRDRGKRPLMGAVSGRLADLTVITAEDPRTEDLDEIMEQIAAGCRAAGRSEGEGYLCVGDRSEAIARAVAVAAPGDLVMVCGKGHERSMCYGTEERPWSDQAAALAALAARL